MTRAKKPPNATRLVEKQRIARTGRRAERLCVWLLRLKGYRVLARNWRTPRAEIDIVARRRRVLVFVEVKLRPQRQRAQDAVSPQQWHRIARAAEGFCAARPHLRELVWRFDLMACAPRHWPKHIEDVWRSR